MMKMKFLVASLLFVAAAGANAQSSVDTLREFVRDVKTGRAEFTQTVTSPDGAKKKVSSGRFEFSRPNRFRFTYQKPFEQVIVADGQKVWIYDADLNQASSRKFGAALGSTPAALLAGGSLDKDFNLAAQPSKDGFDWVEATPKAKDGSFKSVRVGFKGKTLASVEVVDAFGQRSLLQFGQFVANEAIKPETFVFTVPKGADVIEQ
jgi:outer membrane lipoprotein carrier protein